MLEQLGWIQFKTHRVIVSRDEVTDRIYCFKHTPTRCELESFDQADAAADYIIAPMTSISYLVVIDGDETE